MLTGSLLLRRVSWRYVSPERLVLFISTADLPETLIPSGVDQEVCQTFSNTILILVRKKYFVIKKKNWCNNTCFFSVWVFCRCTGERWRRMGSCWTPSKPHMLLKELQVMKSVITSGTQPTGMTGKVSTLHIICLRMLILNLNGHPKLNFSKPLTATVENFSVVETLSDKAVIIYQTHKVQYGYPP